MQDSQSRTPDSPPRSPFETSDTPPRTSTKTRPLNRILFSGIALGALLILYLLIARTVTVSSNADNFRVEDNSLLGISLGHRLLLLPGEHSLSVSAPGYIPRELPLTLSDEKNSVINVELQPLPGQLLVNANTSAQVYLNGQLAGASSKTLPDIAAGSHQLRVTATHYKPFEQTINIEGRQQTTKFDVVLQPDWISREITSVPAGASVFVDQQPAGRTPTTVTLPRGNRQLRVELEGYQTWQQALNINPDTPFTLPAIELQPQAVEFRITSNPSGAQVTIDGTYQGQTPLTVQLPPAAMASVVLIKDGYKAQQRDVDPGDKEDSLHVNMAARMGSINLKVTPENARVSVDGQQQRGNGNRYALQLPTHPHKLHISAPGYESRYLTLTPRTELAQHLNVSLLTLEQAHWKNTPNLSQSPTGQTLKLFKPEVSFTMGASRRQQGRRANETQHQVKLDRPFYLATQAVTNRDFRRFQRFHSSGNVKGKSLNGEQQPVVNVSWLEAAQFCNWLSLQAKLTPVYGFTEGSLTSVDMQSNGYRLPTEAEWAWAARYQDGTMATFPWSGNSVKPPTQSANYADRSSLPLIGKVIPGYEDRHAVTAAARTYAANAKGLYDLAGNVSEWVHDYYGIKAGLSLKAAANPTGPASGDSHVIRGSSWKSASLSELRLAYRESGNGKQNHVGFRIARYVFEEQ